MSRDETFAAIFVAHAQRAGPLLPILHDVQAAFGCVDAAAERIIAHELNLSRAEVHGVVSFYHDFTAAADPRPVVQLCRAEACQARGVDALAPLFEQDERITLEAVYCLGLCAIGPAAMIGTRVVARLDEASAARLLDEVA